MMALLFPFVCTQFGTGARPSEMIALRWGDVDLETQVLKILLANGPKQMQRIAEWFDSQSLPPQVTALKRHSAPCHKTGKNLLCKTKIKFYSCRLSRINQSRIITTVKVFVLKSDLPKCNGNQTGIPRGMCERSHPDRFRRWLFHDGFSYV